MDLSHKKPVNKYVISIESYLEAASVFHWAYMRHYVLWFLGQERNRHQRTEKVLKRLVHREKLQNHLYGNKLVYTQARKGKGFNEIAILPRIAHGLACTECLVRFYRSRRDGIVIAEKYFKMLGAVPEWGILYPEGKILLLEFSTKSNFLYTGLMRGKLSAYRRNLEKIESKFQARAIVVFVIDIPRQTLGRWVGSWRRDAGSVADAPAEGDRFPSDPFFFADYETFLQVPLGQQLTTPIYYWMDGKEYPLTQHD